MDALARLYPVAHQLLAQVDLALATLGAPAEHPVWNLLRRLGATPGDVVGHLAGLRPEPLREAALALHAEAETYRSIEVPVEVAWSGAAAEVYRAHAAALAVHLGRADAVAADASMIGRLAAMAAYAEQAADWVQDARDRMARALADVFSSTQAVQLKGGPGLGGLEELTRAPAGVPAATVPAATVPAATVLAAADIAVWLLAAAEEVLVAGQDLHARFAAELGEVPFVAPEHGPTRIHATVRLEP